MPVKEINKMLVIVRTTKTSTEGNRRISVMSRPREDREIRALLRRTATLRTTEKMTVRTEEGAMQNGM